MKAVKKILLVILIIFAAVFLFKDLLARLIISSAVKAMTGYELKIKSINIALLKSQVGVGGLLLHNPQGFPDKLMVDMPKIFVYYDLGAFLKGKAHLRELAINLKEFTVERNAAGKLNLDNLKPFLASKGKPVEFKIDVLNLAIGKIVFKDYSAGQVPSVREFKVNLNERFENIDNPEKLIKLIVVRSLASTNIAGLTGFDLNSWKKEVSGTIKQATSAVSQTIQQTTGGLEKDIKSILQFGQ